MENHECCKIKNKSNHWCNTGDQMTDHLIEMADTAWETLMLEKMKKAYEKKRGPQMDKMAEAAVNTSLTYWMGKMKSNADLNEALGNLKKAFS